MKENLINEKYINQAFYIVLAVIILLLLIWLIKRLYL